MAKKWTQARWKKEADKWFSRFIRNRDKGQCYTCPHRNDPKKMQCGHFVPRQYTATRYDERNNHCQCYACNMFYGGQPDIYAINLKRDYGEGIVEELNKLRTKLEIGMDFEGIANHYKSRVEGVDKGVESV